eukprot:1254772-Rhodomonas_salina.1
MCLWRAETSMSVGGGGAGRGGAAESAGGAAEEERGGGGLQRDGAGADRGQGEQPRACVRGGWSDRGGGDCPSPSLSVVWSERYPDFTYIIQSVPGKELRKLSPQACATPLHHTASTISEASLTLACARAAADCARCRLLRRLRWLALQASQSPGPRPPPPARARVDRADGLRARSVSQRPVPTTSPRFVATSRAIPSAQVRAWSEGRAGCLVTAGMAGTGTA